jgi:hypothetical protein
VGTRSHKFSFYSKVQIYLRWVQYKLKVQLKDQQVVILNMDETSLSSHVVTKYGTFVPLNKITFSETEAPVKRRSNFVCTLKGMVCNSTDLMKDLPQVLLPKYNTKQDSPPQKTKQLYAAMGAPLQVWHKTSGWSSTKSMILWLRAVAKVIRTKMEGSKIVLVFDCAPTHLNEKLLKEARRQQVHILVVPSKCTWILQPLDVYVYAGLKRSWRKRLAKEELKSATGCIDLASRVRVTGQAIRDEIVLRSWEGPMEKVGLSTDLTKLNKRLKRLTDGMDFSPQKPSQQDLLFLFGKHSKKARVDWSKLLLEDFPAAEHVADPTTGTPAPRVDVPKHRFVHIRRFLPKAKASASAPHEAGEIGKTTEPQPKKMLCTIRPLSLRPWNRLPSWAGAAASSASSSGGVAGDALNFDVHEIKVCRVGPSLGTRAHVAKMHAESLKS